MEYNELDPNAIPQEPKNSAETVPSEPAPEAVPQDTVHEPAESKDAPAVEENYTQSPLYYGQENEAVQDVPKAEPAQAQGSPYAGYGNPYAAYTAPQTPYGQNQAPANNAYEQPSASYGQSANPYEAQNGYQANANPYAQAQNPYGQGYAAQGAQTAAPNDGPWAYYQSGNGANPASHTPKKTRTRRVWPAVVVTAICCLLAGVLVGSLLVPLFMADTKVNESTNTVAPAPDTSIADDGDATAGHNPDFTFGDGSDDSLSYVASGGLADMAEAVTPSIVGVLNLTYQSQNNYYGYGYGYGSSQQSEPSLEETGSGSGVIISEDGYIVTNAHVVDGADALKILMNDGEEVDAVLVGTDSVTDLAVVKIDRTGLDAANLGDSDLVRVGEMAVAIGNPLGSELAGTVTMGIISAVDRTIEVDNQFIDVLQTDAAINPGNSGGALVNQAGQVIGITSAKTVVAGYDELGNAISAEGIGYAIPINNAKPIIEQLIHTGEVPRPALGVSVQLVTNMIEADQKGLLVTEVTPGGSADNAGIKVNDVITHMNGVSFESLSEFKKELMTYSVGDVITLTVSRNEENIQIDVTLMDAKALETETEDEQSGDNSQWIVPGYGGFGGYGNGGFNPFG